MIGRSNMRIGVSSMTIGLLLCLLVACEEQPIPIPEPVIPTEGRVMLLEDLTGVQCVPCHNANLFIEALLEVTDGSVVTYGIHGDLQSEPHTESKYDFRYPDAANLEFSIDFLGKPSALFNRVAQSNGMEAQTNPATWQAFVDEELAKPQVIEIELLSTFDNNTRRIGIDLSVIALEPIEGETNIHVVVTESHLFDVQSTPPPDGIVIEYEHNHVMKASLTGLQGDFLSEGLEENIPVRRSYSYTIPEASNGEWNPDNIEIIAFVTAQDRNGEVQQAAQIGLK